MTIYNITLIAETPKAYLLSWYDTNYKGKGAGLGSLGR